MFKSSSKPKHEKGQGLVEYALILVLVSIVVIVALSALGPTVSNIFTNINASLGVGGGGGGGGGSLIALPTEPSSLSPQTSQALAMLCSQDNLAPGTPVNINDPNGYNMQNGTVNLPYGQYNCP